MWINKISGWSTPKAKLLSKQLLEPARPSWRGCQLDCEFQIKAAENYFRTAASTQTQVPTPSSSLKCFRLDFWHHGDKLLTAPPVALSTSPSLRSLLPQTLVTNSGSGGRALGKALPGSLRTTLGIFHYLLSSSLPHPHQQYYWHIALYSLWTLYSL